MQKTLLLCLFSFFSFFLFAQNDIVQKNQKILSKEVYFDFGKYTIRPDADSTLREILAFCDNRKNISIHMTAHTDAIGSDANNLTLSKNRMAAVQQFLEERGLQADSISTAVFGEKNPVANNDTETGRRQNRRATIDIYEFQKLFKIEGEVRDKETGKGIEADVIVRTKDTRDSIRTDTSGRFESLVPLGAVVGVETYAKGYFLESVMLKALPNRMPELKIDLPPIRAGEAIDLKNLYFVGNQAVLLDKSKPELPKILKFMQINSCAKIEIAGHINLPNRPPVGETTWHYDLSVNRAKLIYDYLLVNGIPEKRLAYKGYGNWEMRYPKARTEQLQAKNRRVEIRILEEKMNN